jgi:hypothetical protein
MYSARICIKYYGNIKQPHHILSVSYLKTTKTNFTRGSREPHGPSVFVCQVLHSVLVVALKPVCEHAVVALHVIDVVLKSNNLL